MGATSYFNKLYLIWREMDLCREIVWDCLVQYSKLEEIDRVYDFLAGLNTKFNAVHSRILGHRPVPSLMEVCLEVRLEEDRSSATNNPSPNPIDSAAFGAKSFGVDGDKQNSKSPPICEHCKKSWHTKDQCWKLHGRPPNGKCRLSNDKSKSGRALVSDSIDVASQSQVANQTDLVLLGSVLLSNQMIPLLLSQEKVICLPSRGWSYRICCTFRKFLTTYCLSAK
ncbi:uncharacterized protein LOC120079712 [Benincasa hispida]|uniref:uncharacterized protein LOC120079712 n=1 Tax=Benincasa hispida TaxID=102211 RepID=UPI001901B420|nr:uncharacterized protein LOC120079712 [Benincasa hispida]